VVKVTVLTGQYAGRTRSVDETVDPVRLLKELVFQGWGWSIDLSDATEQEFFLWVRADMAMRIVGALMRGRVVTFAGTLYWAKSQEDIERVVGEVEDAISNSGYNVFVESDDEIGVTIGIHSTENMVQ
jgi:hypothetical protein